MRKLFLFALLGLFVWTAPVHAGWNLRQNDDGTTDWVRDDAVNVEQAIPVGVIYLNHRFENVSSASTEAVAIPITGVKVTNIQVVSQGEITATDAVLTFWWLAQSETIGVLPGNQSVREISNGTGRLTIEASTISEGDNSELGFVDAFVPTSNNNLEKGGKILIETNGGSTNDVDLLITITLEPR